MGFCKAWLQALLTRVCAAVGDGDAKLEALQATDQAAARAPFAPLHVEADVFCALPFHPCTVLLHRHNGLVGRKRRGHTLAKRRLPSVHCLGLLRLAERFASGHAGRGEGRLWGRGLG